MTYFRGQAQSRQLTLIDGSGQAYYNSPYGCSGVYCGHPRRVFVACRSCDLWHKRQRKPAESVAFALLLDSYVFVMAQFTDMDLVIDCVQALKSLHLALISGQLQCLTRLRSVTSP